MALQRNLTIQIETTTHPDGFLDVHIDQAENLPNTDKSYFNMFGKDLTDPFASIQMGDVCIGRTKCINDDLNPKWDEHSVLPLYGDLTDVIINVDDDDLVGSERVASVSFEVEKFTKGNIIDGWFDLKNKGKQCGRIKLTIQHFPKTANSRLLRDNYKTDPVSMF